jgi:dTDP-4-dehydrorhamnose 3,5-epimerase
MIRKNIEEKLTTQHYGRGDRIPDVDIYLLDKHEDKTGAGSFIEIFITGSTKESITKPNGIKQVNYSTMAPGAIKGFHLHYLQTDYWFVPPGNKMYTILHDCREGREPITETFLLGPDPVVLRIPPGVAHGVKNVGTSEGVIIYGVTQEFNFQDPDEHRLPWDMLGKDIWEMTRD